MQAKEIFLQAIDVADTVQREAFVNEKCGEDIGLKRKVLSLLAANEDPESYLDQPAARFDVTATACGKANGSGLSEDILSFVDRISQFTRVNQVALCLVDALPDAVVGPNHCCWR